MFNKSKVIVTFLRKKLIACQIEAHGNHTISHVYEFGWDENTLDLVFEKIKKLYKTEDILILLSKEVCYVQKVSVPSDLPADSRRQYILEVLEERIPEILGLYDFDFKIVGQPKEGHDIDVLAFAPISVLTQSLTKAYENTGLEVTAIEPEEIARSRNINPLIGLLLKEDLTGKDEDVLNLSFTSKYNGSKKATKKGDKSLFIFLAIVLTLLLGACALFLVK